MTPPNVRRKLAEAKSSSAGWLLLQLLPGEPEAQGLLALMLYCESRRQARRSAAGGYVPLTEQDVTLWSPPMIAEAGRLLAAAEQAGRMGRFQLEAAIQAVHARRAATGQTDWESIALLYEGLVRLAPTIGALVGRAGRPSPKSAAPRRDGRSWKRFPPKPSKPINPIGRSRRISSSAWDASARPRTPIAAPLGSARTRPCGRSYHGGGRAKRRKGDRARIAPMRRRRKSQGGARTAVDRGRQRVVRSPQTCFS